MTILWSARQICPFLQWKKARVNASLLLFYNHADAGNVTAAITEALFCCASSLVF